MEHEEDKPTVRPTPPPSPDTRRVLVADDEPALARSFERVLRRQGFEVVACEDGNAAVEALMRTSFDVIVADVNMPGTSGIDLLRIARAYDLDVPVILMTGGPEVGSAVQAVELGALQYLAKPVDNPELVRVVTRASRLHAIARVKRRALAELGLPDGGAADLAGLAGAFERALARMTIALQPVVSVSGERAVGYEVLMRSSEPALATPAAVLACAERLGRVHDVGRRVRALAADAIRRLPEEHAMLFVNLHPLDLLDPELADGKGPLAPFADRVVLEISEHGSLDGVRDVEARVSILRYLGFRLALDDVGAGQAGLGGFARLEPEFVKLDGSLVRGVHASPARQKLVRAFVSLCAELGATPIAEAVESAEERDALRASGCDVMQGHLFGKPGPAPVHADGPLAGRSTSRRAAGAQPARAT
ncbi:MAG TPA: EAL domain-containing response regulator [Minicystis sp.]|nr:EAL domain-containing response regulator [Minicystis sp.]